MSRPYQALPPLTKCVHPSAHLVEVTLNIPLAVNLCVTSDVSEDSASSTIQVIIWLQWANILWLWFNLTRWSLTFSFGTAALFTSKLIKKSQILSPLIIFYWAVLFFTFVVGAGGAAVRQPASIWWCKTPPVMGPAPFHSVLLHVTIIRDFISA